MKILVTLALLLAGCGGGATDGGVADLTMAPPAPDLRISTSSDLTMVVRDLTGVVEDLTVPPGSDLRAPPADLRMSPPDLRIADMRMPPVDLRGADMRVTGCALTYAGCINYMDVSTPTINFGGVLSNSYSPKCIRIHVGTTVTWSGNFGSHPLSGASCAPSSPVINSTTGGQGIVFNTPGNYGYDCTQHNGMSGVIQVVP